MAPLVDRGFRLLNRTMKPAAALAVRYFRGPTVVSEGALATLSNQQIEQVTAGGATLIGRQFTWRLRAADLLLEGVVITPQKFDRIEWDLEGRVFVFAVQPEIGLPAAGSVDPRSEWIPASVKLEEVRQS